MKIQDILFVALLLALLFTQAGYKKYFFVAIGMVLFSVPLFSKWIFFTAERMVMYAGALIIFGAFQYFRRR